MAGLLLGGSEPGPLSGHRVAPIGRHVIQRGGGTDLSYGVADVVREQRHRIPVGASWRLCFEHTLHITDPVLTSSHFDPAHLLRHRFSLALGLLRDSALSSCYRLKRSPQRLYAYAQGDIEGDAPTVARIIEGMHEACTASGFDVHSSDMAPLLPDPEE